MTPETVLASARKRGAQLGLPYAGAVTPDEALALVKANPDAKLIDVRTRAEWTYVGRPEDAAEIEWQTFPDMTVNPNFLDELARVAGKESPVLFICRSGVRSHHAALEAHAAGWQTALNVLEGFEGDLDENQKRNRVNGWRFRGLPWSQS